MRARSIASKTWIESQPPSLLLLGVATRAEWSDCPRKLQTRYSAHTLLQQNHTRKPIIQVPKVNTAHTPFVISNAISGSPKRACLPYLRRLHALPSMALLSPQTRNKTKPTDLDTHPYPRPYVLPFSEPSHSASPPHLHPPIQAQTGCSMDFASYLRHGYNHIANSHVLSSCSGGSQVVGRQMKVSPPLGAVQVRKDVGG